MFIPFLEYLIFSPYLIVDDVVIVFAFDIVQDIDPEYNMPEYFMFHLVEILLRPIFRASLIADSPGRAKLRQGTVEHTN